MILSYYFFLLQMEKEFYLMKTELKKEAIIEQIHYKSCTKSLDLKR